MFSDINGSRLWYGSGVQGVITVVGSLYNITDDTDYVFFVLDIPKTGKLYSVNFVTATVLTGDTAFVVRVESVDGSGNPSGNLMYTNSSGTVNIANTDDNKNIECLINSTNGVDVAVGDKVALVFRRSTGSSANMTLRTGSNAVVTNYPYIGDYNITSGETLTKSALIPNVCIKINSNYIVPNSCCFYTVPTASISAFASPKEYGIGFSLGFTAKIIGFWVVMVGFSGTTAKINLYSSPTASPILKGASDVLDLDFLISTSTNRIVQFHCSEPIIVKRDVPYVMALAPQDSTEITFRANSIVSALKEVAPMGAYGTQYYRDTGGTTSFTNTDTLVPLMGPILSSVFNSENIFKGGNLR
jgi:hypothetical protein